MKLLNSPHSGHRDDRILSCNPALFFPSCFSGGIRFGATRGKARSLLRFLNPYAFVQDRRRTGTMYSVASSTLRIVTTRNTSARHAINIPWSLLPAKVYAFVARLTISNRHCRSSPQVSTTFVLKRQCLLHRIFQSSTGSFCHFLNEPSTLARRTIDRLVFPPSSTPNFSQATRCTCVFRHKAYTPDKIHDHI